MTLLPTLQRRTLERDWDLLGNQMQRLMGGISLGEPASESVLWAPRVDFTEGNGQYVLSAEIPGVRLKDVDVEVEGNVLSISGEKNVEREHADERVQVTERRYGAFGRSFTLPSAADPEKINASFCDGVLRVEIAKRPEATGKRIEIKAN